MKRLFLFICSMVLATLAHADLQPEMAQAQAPGNPEGPRVLLDTRYVPPGGSTIRVAAGGDLQAAINAARSGDTIVLDAGATYTTPPDGFMLPEKAGTDWIVIRTSALAALPAEGSRVSPANVAAMAKIVTTNVWPAVQTLPRAHHYRFIGIEFAVAPGRPLNYGIVSLGDGSRAQNSLEVVPHDLIIDRCYIHGNPTGDVSRGVALNSARTAIIDSYISNCHGVGYDTQAIAGWNGPGPYKIVNNYLEGAGENVLFGGSDVYIHNLVPSDIEFRRNLCSKPLSWKTDDPSYAGIYWAIKNNLELKNAQRLLIDGNIFENNWASHQIGFAILFTPRGEDGRVPWAVVQDVSFTNNIVRHVAGAINLYGYDYTSPSRQSQRIKIANNLFDDIGGARWPGNGKFLQVIDGTAYVTVDHNTVLHSHNVLVGESRANTSFTYTNNLSRHNEYGVVGTGTGTGNHTLSVYFTGYVFAKNILTGGPSQSYPVSNFFPASLNDVGFVDLAGGNFRLAANSPYKRAGTDGKDIGADIDLIEAAMAGSDPQPPPPPPPPAPAPGNVVLYASEAQIRGGGWTVVSDPTAAGGARIWHPDASSPKLGSAYANPTHYFEMSFNAEAGRAYRLWIRGKAQNDFWGNDSVWVQFSGSVTSSGAATYRIGTTSGTDINLEDCSGCGLQGWGWQDNGWGVGVMGPLIYFATNGAQTIRVQTREDGLSIDQIVLSPQTYLTAPPGGTRNDNTILPRSSSDAVPPPTVNSISPVSGTTAGGSLITITGTGFLAGAIVQIGGSNATSVNLTGSTSISALTPAHSVGVVDVVVTNTDGQTHALLNGYTYTSPPAVEAVLLADDFNDNSIDTSKWNTDNLFSGYTDAGLPVNERSQRLEIGPLLAGTSGSHYRGIRSASFYDFAGAYCQVETILAAASTTSGNTMLTIGKDANNYYRIYVEAGNLVLQSKLGGTKRNFFTTAYDPLNHRHWRIRHDTATGDVVFETAQGNNGSPGVWVQRYRETWNALNVPVGAVQFELKAGTWQVESNAAGTVIFDNFKAARP